MGAVVAITRRHIICYDSEEMLIYSITHPFLDFKRNNNRNDMFFNFAWLCGFSYIYEGFDSPNLHHENIAP